MNGTILDLNEMRVFLAVASRRSFVGAARMLRMPKATVSRKVKVLESRLGVRLLQRTTRRVSLTEVGDVFQERCARIEDEIADAEATVGAFREKPRGTLRVTAPYTLARDVLVPTLPSFLTRYPELRVWLTLKNEPEDLVMRATDVALSPWPLADSSLATRLIGRVPSGYFATPAYLARRGRPRRPQDLSAHDALLYAGGGGPVHLEWTLARGERTATVPLSPILVCNDSAPLQAAALAGMGIVHAARVAVADLVRAKALAPVLGEWAGPDVEVRAVFPTRRYLLPKVRVFLDFLATDVWRRFASPPTLSGRSPGSRPPE